MAALRAPGTRWSVGCSWKRRGITNTGPGSAWRSDGGGKANRRVSLRLRIRRNSGCVGAFANWRRNTSPPRKSRWRSRASSPASCGQRCSRSQPRRGEPRREAEEVPNGIVMRSEDGPRRRRMIRGTIARIGELAMRHGQLSQLASLDCTSSRRSTVMCALPRATAVTTVYQRDSSSKRPRASVVSAARAPTRRGTT